MMDHINEILASDLLERYVLGDVTREEQMKVDLLRVDYREIREKLDELELTMEHTALENAIPAPPGIKECIIKNIHGESPKPIQSPNSSSFKMSWISIAAGFILGSLGTWALMNNQISKLQRVAVEQAEDFEILHRDCDLLTKQYAFINHTNTLPVLLKGGSSEEQNQVVIYWNERLQQSMLRVIELPGLRSDETFQLWADVNGEMLSLGVFDASEAIADAIPMEYLENATSLNVTIEPKGGSDHPDVSRLTVSQVI